MSMRATWEPLGLALLLALAMVTLAGCAAPGGPVHHGWAEDMERERCLRENNWWRPGDRLDGGGRCDRVNVER